MIIHIAFTGQPIADQPPAPSLNWNKRCGGRGSCNACIITLLEGTFECNGKFLVAGNGTTHQAKACQTKLTSQTGLIDIPSLAIQTQDGSISTTFANHKTNQQRYRRGNRPGTTTVAQSALRTGHAQQPRLSISKSNSATTSSLESPMRLQKLVWNGFSWKPQILDEVLEKLPIRRRKPSP